VTTIVSGNLSFYQAILQEKETAIGILLLFKNILC
jgi:hypothetical protein